MTQSKFDFEPAKPSFVQPDRVNCRPSTVGGVGPSKLSGKKLPEPVVLSEYRQLLERAKTEDWARYQVGGLAGGGGSNKKADGTKVYFNGVWICMEKEFGEEIQARGLHRMNVHDAKGAPEGQTVLVAELARRGEEPARWQEGSNRGNAKERDTFEKGSPRKDGSCLLSSVIRIAQCRYLGFRPTFSSRRYHDFEVLVAPDFSMFIVIIPESLREEHDDFVKAPWEIVRKRQMRENTRLAGGRHFREIDDKFLVVAESSLPPIPETVQVIEDLASLTTTIVPLSQEQLAEYGLSLSSGHLSQINDPRFLPSVAPVQDWSRITAAPEIPASSESELLAAVDLLNEVLGRNPGYCLAQAADGHYRAARFLGS